MGYVVRMPKLGLEMESGTLLEWTIGEGEMVESGETLAEIESEKTTAEVDSREGGVLRRVFLEVGESVPPGTPIGVVAGADEDISGLVGDAEADLADAGVGTPDGSAPEAAGGDQAAAVGASASENGTSAGGASSASGTSSASEASGGPVKASPRAKKRADELDVDLAAVEGTGPQGSVTEADVEAAAERETGENATSGGPVKASPRAKKRADELGVALSSVEGTGPQGSVTEADVEAAAEASGTAAGGGASGGATRTLAEERPFGGMRQTIAKRLSESYREAVHVTEHRDVPAGELLAAANTADAELDADVSMTDVLLVALSAALDEHPAFNATFEDDTHRLWAEQNVCTAVDVEAGLVAPVLPAVNEKSLGEIAEARKELTQRTLDGDYTSGDLQGGTFTVTNLGVLGVESFDPVINPPQVAILGVDTLVDRVRIGDDGGVSGYRALGLDLSFDHRVVDGADAARFLGTLVDHLEEPWPLLPDGVERPAERAASGVDADTPLHSATGADSLENEPRHAVASNPSGMAGAVRVGGVEQAFGESDGEPEPVELFLGSLAACLSLSVRYQTEMRDAAVEGIDVDVDTPERSGSVESISVTVTLDAPDVDDETLERCVEYGERACHVAELLRDDLPVDVSWERAKS